MIAIQAVALVVVCAVAIYEAPEGNWDLGLLCVLFAFAAFSDLTAITTNAQIKISGSFLALVLAMVFLGGTPAALLGVMTIAVGWLRWRDAPHDLLNNLLTYATFPLVGGLAFLEVTGQAGIDAGEPIFYVLVFALFQIVLAINFAMTAGYGAYLERVRFSEKLKVLPPVLPSEFASAMMAIARRLHLPRDRDRGDRPLRRRPRSPSSTCSGSCCSPSSGPRSWSCAPSSSPASRSGC